MRLVQSDIVGKVLIICIFSLATLAICVLLLSACNRPHVMIMSLSRVSLDLLVAGIPMARETTRHCQLDQVLQLEGIFHFKPFAQCSIPCVLQCLRDVS